MQKFIRTRRCVTAWNALLFLVGTIGLPAGAPAQELHHPHKILIIRHGEKPIEKKDDPHPDQGLAPEGKLRAKELHKLFEVSKERPDPFPVPDFVFATSDSDKSHRPRLTVEPYVKLRDKGKKPDKFIEFNHDFKNADTKGLAQHLFENQKYLGKVILICWHHGEIPHLMNELKAKDYPATWNHPDPKIEIFDRVWVIEYKRDGKVSFKDEPQCLLPTDSVK